MDKFLTSDTHFFHKNVLKFQPDERPFADIVEMNDTLVDRWNSLVKPTDEIYHLGDFGFANPDRLASILKRLNGRKYFIFGNHDHQMTRPQCAEHFQWMKNYHEIKVDKRTIVLHHYPIYSWNKQGYGSLHFYGHTHGDIPFMFEGQSLDVGVDTNNCYPYNLDELIERMDNIRTEKGIEVVDARYRRISDV